MLGLPLSTAVTVYCSSCFWWSGGSPRGHPSLRLDRL